MKILLSGGCKNGKSYYAQKMLNDMAGTGKKYYIATMQPYDEEDQQRILNHQKERENWGFITIEQPKDIGMVTQYSEKNSSALLDSTTALLMNEMYHDNTINSNAYLGVIDGLKRICSHFQIFIIVSDSIYSDALAYKEYTRAYQFGLAQIDKFLAKELDMVIEICFGNMIFHKGADKIETDYWRRLSG